jgi:hypothetical protein
MAFPVSKGSFHAQSLAFSDALNLPGIPPEINGSSWDGQSHEASCIRGQFMKRHADRNRQISR